MIPLEIPVTFATPLINRSCCPPLFIFDVASLTSSRSFFALRVYLLGLVFLLSPATGLNLAEPDLFPSMRFLNSAFLFADVLSPSPDVYFFCIFAFAMYHPFNRYS